jgi:hypothetical protein
MERRAAFQRVYQLRKTVESFDVALIVLQREAAKVHEAIEVVRRLSDEQKRDLDRAVEVLP